MDKIIEREIARIEETQRALRDSIKKAKELADDADKLLKQHKETLRDQRPN